jgi:hypothetical protein
MYSDIKQIDVGLITNLPSTDVVWSEGNNIRFKIGSVYKTFGKELITSLPSIMPIRAMFTFVAWNNTTYTIICSDAKVYAYSQDYTVYSDITPSSAPTSDSIDVWEFALVGGLPILTNGKDNIWQWAAVDAVLTPLTNAPEMAKHIISFGLTLFTGNIQDGAYDYPARVKWPNIAKLTEWDITTTSIAGRQDLVNPSAGIDAVDKIQAFGISGERLVNYSKRNIWFASLADYPHNFAFKIGISGIGLLAPRAKVDVDGISFFMGEDDFYMLADTLTPIGFNIRNACFPNLNKAVVDTSFSFYQPSKKEVWFCVPTSDNTTPNQAFIYQLETKSWAINDVDFLAHTFNWDETNTTWDTLTYGSWDEITDARWDLMSTTGIIPYEVVGDDQGDIFKFDYGYNNNGKAITGYVETGDKDFGDSSISTILKTLFPEFKSQEERSAVFFQVGSKKALSDDISWSNITPFIVGVNNKCDFRKNGKYLRVRLYSSELDTPWILNKLRIGHDNQGTR